MKIIHWQPPFGFCNTVQDGSDFEQLEKEHSEILSHPVLPRTLALTNSPLSLSACRQPAVAVYDSIDATLLNLALALLPTAETAAKHTTMIRANMTAYSTAVGPSSDTMNRLTLLTNLLILNPLTMCPNQGGLSHGGF